MRSPFSGDLEWLVMRSPSLEAQVAAVETRILELARREAGAPAANRLSALSAWLVAEEQHAPGTARKIREAAKDDAEVAETLRGGPLAHLAATLLGAPVRLHDVVRLRTTMRMQDFTHSRPHQDAALWPDNPNDLNVWIALCDVGEDLAPLQIVPGTGAILRPHVENQYKQFEVAGFDEAREIPRKIPLSRGEALLFSPRLIHYAAPNLTDTVRWSLDFRFSGTQA